MNGPGVFYDLHNLKPDDEVTITRKDGSTPVFRVTRVELFPRTSSRPGWSTTTSTILGCVDHLRWGVQPPVGPL